MKRVLPVILALCLLLCACGGTPEETQPTTTAPAVTTAPTEPPQTTAPATEPPQETTQPQEALYHNPLTGEPCEEPWTVRPFAITLNNVPAALPHHGTTQADIIYECLVEGGVTRCLAIFSKMANVDKYGSVRSARNCFVDVAQAYDAIFAHAGGSTPALDYLDAIGWDELDALSGLGSDYFYRDQGRLSSGYDWEHTLFASGSDVIAFAKEKGYDLTREDGIDYGWTFAEDAAPDGETANKVIVNFWDGGKTTTMNYNAETGLYEGYEWGEDMIDGNTGEIVGFKNVLVLHSDTYMDGILTMMDLTGTGEGYFACGGKIVPIIWIHEENTDPFTYTLTDGTPLILGIGRSYVGIVPIESTVEYYE